MNTPPPPFQPEPTPFHQPPARTQRRLIVEIVEARDLLPKDGHGSSSAYVVVDFDAQKKRTSTKFRDLNPVWNEMLEFVVSDPKNMEREELDVEVYNDKRFGNGSGRKNNFLGRVKIYGSQFARRGEEGLVYFPLEKKSVFSWVRGDIGLKIYYFDEVAEEEPPPPPPQGEDSLPPPQVLHNLPPEKPSPGVVVVEEGRVIEGPVPSEMCHRSFPEAQPPPMVVVEESSPPQMVGHVHCTRPPSPPPSAHPVAPVSEVHYYPPEVRNMQAARPPIGERVRIPKKPNGDFSPRVINSKIGGETVATAVTAERSRPYDLVEPMQYLFVKIEKARGLAPSDGEYVKVRTSNHFKRTKPAIYRPGEPTDSPEWKQVFALGHNRADSAVSGETLEISVWDAPSESFLGGVCFDLSEVPVRDPPDSPLAPQWYRLEGSATDQSSGRVSGDIQLSVWIGTQADEAFPEAWSSDVPHVVHTRSKVYQSPKLWYLRATVVEAQDLHIAPNLPPLTAPEVRVKAQLGFQSARTSRGSMNNHSGSFHWNEDLIFVAGEPLEDCLILVVEDRTTKETQLLGHAMIPVSSIEQRIDERHVPSKWHTLDGGGGGGPYCGRISLRLCLEGGYHVLEEAAHVCSDFRPTAKQLWKPAIGILELGILGARGLLPMKAKDGGKGSTDAYCVAKYGKKMGSDTYHNG